MLGAAPRAAAQDTQYWSDAFGMQARLLGGVVIGSDEDVSAVYYNPGADRARRQSPVPDLAQRAALRADQLQRPVGAERARRARGWSALSNMFAGTLPLGGRDTHQRLAYSLLTRQSFAFGAQLRDLPLDSFAPVPAAAAVHLGRERARQPEPQRDVGRADLQPGRGRKHWGFGASLFIPIRSQTWSQSVERAGRERRGADRARG